MEQPEFKDNRAWGKYRGALWTLFWMLFLGTPIAVLAAMFGSNSNPAQMTDLIFPILGSFATGLTLAALLRRPDQPISILGLGCLLGVGICIAHAGMVFVGCLMVVSSRN